MKENCSICYENTINVSTKCRHQFCSECLFKWKDKKSSCPICRSNFSIQNNSQFQIETSYVYLSAEERNFFFSFQE